MAKSKPIGVRFDERILKKYPDLSPQKILNKLTDMDLRSSFIDGIETVKCDPIKLQIKTVKYQAPFSGPPVTIKIKAENHSIPPIPVRNPGEDIIDFAARKNEWKVKYSQ